MPLWRKTGPDDQGDDQLAALEKQVYELTQELSSSRDELATAREEAALQKDRYVRQMAEMDNYKKRVERNAADQAQRSKKDLLGKILGVMDNLERALAFQDSADTPALAQGLRLTQWQLNELLRSEGLKPMPTVGEPFDPHFHEAIETVSGDGLPEGTIVAEIRKGYLLGETMLRPAQVKVSDGTGKNE